ncbi:MAG: Uma2 family endonuclease [Cyanobacteria bacterium J06634_5]
MTFTSTRYKTYEDYLKSDLGPDGNFRLLSNGEVIELPPEDKENDFIATELTELLKRILKNRRLVSTATEIQVNPVGDNRVNRKPDLTVLLPEHIALMNELKKNAILLGMPAPSLVAEIVSPGSGRTPNYKRDYEWKKQQYEWWEIPEYWIIDRHREQVVVFILIEGIYEEHLYKGPNRIVSQTFPTLQLSADKLLSGDII